MIVGKSLVAPLRQPARIPFPAPKLRGRSFQDDFLKDAVGTSPSGWTTWNGVTLAVQPGGILVYNPSGGVSAASTPLVGNDMYVEALVQMGSSEVDVGARYTGSNGYGYWVLIPGSNLRINRQTGSTFTQIANMSLSTSQTAWYHLAIMAVGSQISAFFNHQLMLTATDTQITSGAAAIHGYSSPCYFQKFRAVFL
jgi:pectate lyase